MTGFNSPHKISNELSDFLSVQRGTLLDRVDVTHRINAYIKEHNLQGMLIIGKDGIEKIDNSFINTSLPKSDKRSKYATQLRKLLNPKSSLSYFNLQTYISPHFTKPFKLKDPDYMEIICNNSLNTKEYIMNDIENFEKNLTIKHD